MTYQAVSRSRERSEVVEEPGVVGRRVREGRVRHPVGRLGEGPGGRVDAPRILRVVAAFTELTQAI